MSSPPTDPFPDLGLTVVACADVGNAAMSDTGIAPDQGQLPHTTDLANVSTPAGDNTSTVALSPTPSSPVAQRATGPTTDFPHYVPRVRSSSVPAPIGCMPLSRALRELAVDFDTQSVLTQDFIQKAVVTSAVTRTHHALLGNIDGTMAYSVDELVAFTPDMAHLTFSDPSLLVSVVFQNPTGQGVYREWWPLLVGIFATHPSIQAQESEESMMDSLAEVYADAIREAADPETEVIELDKSTVFPGDDEFDEECPRWRVVAEAADRPILGAMTDNVTKDGRSIVVMLEETELQKGSVLEGIKPSRMPEEEAESVTAQQAGGINDVVETGEAESQQASSAATALVIGDTKDDKGTIEEHQGAGPSSGSKTGRADEAPELVGIVDYDKFPLDAKVVCINLCRLLQLYGNHLEANGHKPYLKLTSESRLTTNDGRALASFVSDLNSSGRITSVTSPFINLVGVHRAAAISEPLAAVFRAILGGDLSKSRLLHVIQPHLSVLTHSGHERRVFRDGTLNVAILSKVENQGGSNIWSIDTRQPKDVAEYFESAAPPIKRTRSKSPQPSKRHRSASPTPRS